MENNINVLTLPVQTSDKVQPLDVGIFAPAKKAWLKVKRANAGRTGFRGVKKEDFPKLLKELR